MRTNTNMASIVLTLAVVVSGCEPRKLPVTPSAGEQAFTVCLGCHAAESQNRPTGPNLHSLIGRPAGSIDGYFFSEPLKKSGIVWDEATLDAFIANPSALVPGTFMLNGVPDAARRKAIVGYLQTLQ